MATACVSQRCGLCAFELQEGDKIVASESGFASSAICMLTRIVTDDGQQSAEIYNNYSMEDESGARFTRCQGACRHLDGQAIGCHAICAKHAPSTSRTSLLEVLAYQYEPSPIETTTRLRWLESTSAPMTLARILKHAKPHLPQELRL